MPKSLKAGDVLGVTLDQSDFPVKLRFYVNGTLYHEVRGPSADATPVVELHDAESAAAVNFGTFTFEVSPPPGFDGIIKTRSIL